MLRNNHHFLGFLALATLPVFWSITAYMRSPMSPRSVIYEELSSSPSIDFTGYLHMETTVTVAVRPWFINSHSLWNSRVQIPNYDFTACIIHFNTLSMLPPSSLPKAPFYLFTMQAARQVARVSTNESPSFQSYFRLDWSWFGKETQ